MNRIDHEQNDMCPNPAHIPSSLVLVLVLVDEFHPSQASNHLGRCIRFHQDAIPYIIPVDM